MLQTLKNFAKLVYDHSCNFRDFSNLERINIESHLVALIYDWTNNNNPDDKIHRLNNLLQGENGIFKTGIFHVPSSNYADFYLMGHSSDSLGLGPYIKNAKLGIFCFTYTDLFGQNVENYMQYISNYSVVNLESNTCLNSLYNNKRSLILSINQQNQNASKFSKKNNQLLSKLVTAKNVIRKLSEKLKENPLDDEQNQTNCINCKNSRKNIILLPCGDLIICKECLMLTLQFPLNTNIKNERFKCPKCNEKVNQAREVFY